MASLSESLLSPLQPSLEEGLREAMTGEILHVVDISTNLMTDPSQQIIVGSFKQRMLQTSKTLWKV